MVWPFVNLTEVKVSSVCNGSIHTLMIVCLFTLLINNSNNNNKTNNFREEKRKEIKVDSCLAFCYIIDYFSLTRGTSYDGLRQCELVRQTKDTSHITGGKQKM